MSSACVILKYIPIISRAVLVVALLAVTGFSLTQKFPFNLSHADKLLHISGYFTLTILAILSFPNHRKYIALLTLFFGILIEILQIFQPGRSFHMNDLVANAIGIITAITIAWIIKQVLFRRTATDN